MAPRFALRPMAGCVMLACAGSGWANPTGPSVAAGAASFATAGKTLSVTNAPGTIINWQGFSIGAGETTRFLQQSSSSAVLNRVVGSDMSSILGTLSSNGRVFLVNPHGIVVGAGARIDTASFIASTLNITDNDFLRGNFKFEGGGNGVLRNEGAIRASGDIMLVGPRVENAGLIRSDNGSVLLAAGRKVTITSPDAQGVKFEIQAPSDTALNIGAIEARSAASMLAGTLRHSGDIRVTTGVDAQGRVALIAQKDAMVDAGALVSATGAKGGEVTIQSGETTLVAGRVEAMGTQAHGGTVHLLGDRVGVTDGAVVDVSGQSGGGTILVGGDYKGANPQVQNAARTFLGADATLRSDAIASGDGGKVIVWADEITRAYGSIAARGGSESGNGGFVEVSGKEWLDFQATVDATAPHGAVGTLLLDPKFLEISDAGSLENLIPGVNNLFASNITATTRIRATGANSISAAAANVVLQAHSDITFASDVVMTEPGVGLTAQAGKSILVNANISTNNGNVMLTANETTAAGVDTGQRDVGMAVISMAAGTAINAGPNGNVILRLAPGTGHDAGFGDITVANIAANNVSIINNAPDANSRIVRSAGNPLIGALNGLHLEHTGTGAGASIGTALAPMRIQTPRVEAHMTNGAGGIFIDSPNPGDLQIGGVDFYSGPVRGIQALAGGPIAITAAGKLTRFAGSGAGCGSTGGTGGPICAVGVTGPVTLTAAALGGPGPAGRLHVTSGGLITAQSTAMADGGIFIHRPVTGANSIDYNLSVAGAQPVELSSASIFSVTSNISLPGSSVVIESFSGNGGATTSIAFVAAAPITVDAGALELRTPPGAGVHMNQGTTIFNTPVTVSGGLSMQSGASATFNGPTSIAGFYRHELGTLGGTGVVALSGPANIWSGGTIASSGGVSASSMTINGTPQLTGRLALAGGGPYTMTDGVLTIGAAGRLEIGGADFVVNNGATIFNGGLVDIQSDAAIRHLVGATPVFANSGTLRKSGGAGTSIIGNPITVTNAAGALIDVASGMLQVPNGMPINNGTINVAEGTTFSTSNTVLTNSATGIISGTGTVDVGGATLVNNGRLQPAASGTGTLSITGNFLQGAGGNLDIDLTGLAPDQIDRVAVSGNVTLGGALNVRHIDGFNPPSDSSFPILSHASRTGDFAAFNFLDAAAPYASFYGAQLNPGDYRLALGAVVNQWTAGAAGTWQTSANWSLGHVPTSGEDALIPDVGAPGPNATITVSQPGQAARRVTSQENITVDAAGALTLGPLNSQVNGALNVEGSLALNGPISANSITLSGSGVLDAAVGSLPNLTMTGGTLSRSGLGDLTITGPFNASGGFIAPSGGDFITSGVSTITGVVVPFTNWRNSGTINLDTGRISAINPGVTFTNNIGGIVNIASPDANPFSAVSTIANAGVINKNPGSAASQTIEGAFTNVAAVGSGPAGMLNINSGTLVLPNVTSQAGIVNIAAGATLATGGGSLVNDGLIAGAGRVDLGGVTATLTNNARLRPMQGRLTIDGNLVQAASASLEIGASGELATQHSALVVTGSAELGGSTLNVTAAPGYTPAINDSYTVVNAASVTGSFSTLSGTNFGSTLFATYAPASATVAVGTSAPVNFWLPNADGAWDIAGNWSLGVVPTAAHFAKIERPGDITVTIPVAVTAAPNRLRSYENITVLGGTLDLDNPSRINGTLAVTGGTLQGDASLTVVGPLSLNAATLAGPGGITVVGTTGVSVGASQLSGTLTTTGLNVISGALGVGPSGVLNLIGDGPKTIGAGTLTNGGTVNFGGTAPFVLNVGAVVNNNPGGAFNVTGPANLTLDAGSAFNNGGLLHFTSDADIVAGAGAGLLTNPGTLRKSASAGTTTIADPIVVLASGGFDVLSGTLDLASNSNTFSSGARFTGPGAHLVTGNSTFNGDITSNGLVLQSGTFGGTASFTGTTTWTGGTMAGAFTVPALSTLNVTGAAGKAVDGALASLTNNGALNIAGSGPLTLSTGGSLVNNGVASWSGPGAITINAGSTLANAAGATFNLNAAATDTGIAGAGVLANAGTLNSTAAGITTVIGSVFNNTGTVNVDGGTLRFTGDGTDTGAYAVDAGTTLDFAAGTRTVGVAGGLAGPGTLLVSGGTQIFNAAHGMNTVVSGGVAQFNSDIAGAGSFTVRGGEANVNAAFAAGTTTLSAGTANFNGARPHATSTLNLGGGTLGGTGNLTVTSGGEWSGGTLAGAGASLTIGSGAVFNVTGANTRAVEGATLNVATGGALNLAGTGDLALNNGATVANAGTFDIQSDADIVNAAGGATFTNTATLRKSVGSDISNVGSNALFVTTNVFGATIDVLSGTLQMSALPTNAGAIRTAAGTTFATSGNPLVNEATGRIGGLGTIAATALVNNGTMAPGGLGAPTSTALGTLGIAGAFTQNAGGVTEVRLGPAGASDVLAVSGAATLGGRLNLDAAPGYVPATGDAFTPVTFGPGFAGIFARVSKTFANEVIPTYGAGSVTTTLGPTNRNTWLFDGVGGLWTDVGVWSQDRSPIATDDVVIDRPLGVFTVTIPAGAFAANSLTSQENVTLLGALTLANASTINGTLTLTGGTLAGAGPLTVNGTTSIAAGAATVNGTLSTTGLAMTGGSLAVGAGSVLNLGAGAKTLTGAGTLLTNSGTTNLAGAGDLVLNGGATFNNLGTLDLQTNAGLSNTAGPNGNLINAGTITKSAGGGTSTIGAGINSTSNGGTFNVAAGNTLTHAAVNTFNAGTSFTGAGTNAVASDSTLNGALASTNLTLASGNFAGTATLGGTTSWSGGNVTGAITVPAGSTFNIRGDTNKTISGAAASLTNAGRVNIAGTGNVVLTGGGSLVNNNVLHLDAPVDGMGVTGAGTFTNASTLNVTSATGAATIASGFTNTGVVNVDGGRLRLTSDGTDTGAYAVDAATTLEIGGGTRIIAGAGSVTGAGTLLVSGGTAILNASPATANTTVTGGIAQFNSNITGGNVFNVTGGEANVNAAYAASATNISGGVANFNGAAGHTTGALNLTGGTLGGTGDLTVATAGTWSAGSVAGAGASLTVGNGATLAISGDAPKTIEAARLTIAPGGTANLSGTGNLALNNAASLVNNGTFDVQSDADIVNAAGAATLTNNATLRKSGGASVTDVGSNAFFVTTNPATGTIEVLSGTLRVNSMPANAGTIRTAAGTTFATGGNTLTNAGRVGGRGTIDVGVGQLVNNNIVAPGAADAGGATGTLSVSGAFTQGAGGVTEIRLVAPGVSDTLAITGGATLGGRMNLEALPGYAPASGDIFTPITAAGGLGGTTFARVSKGVANEVLPAYNPTNVALTLGPTNRNTWIFDGPGAWTDVGRWSQDRTPIAADNVAIDRPLGLFTVTVPAGAFSAASLTSQENVTVLGSLSLGAASTINGTLTLTGGTLAGAGPLTVNGTTSIAAGAATVNGTLSTTGLAMTGGSLAVGAGGVLNLGAGAKTLTGAGTLLTNSGTTNLAGAGDLVLNGGATFNNLGTLDLQTNAGLSNTAGPNGNLINAGTITKSAGGGTSTIGAGIDSTSNGGTFNVAAGNALALTGGTHNLNAGTIVTGAGRLRSTATVNVNAPLTLPNGLTFDLAGGTVNNAAGLAIDGPFNWSAGTLGGIGTHTTSANANTVITGTVTLSGGVWDNFGPIALTGAGQIVLGGAAPTTFVNRGSGVITDTSTGALPITTATTRVGKAFSNAGTFAKNAGSAATQTLDVPMTNTGTLDINAGTLIANGLPTNNGIIDLALGTTFSTDGAALVNGGLGLIKGNGTVIAPVVTNNGTVSPGDSPGALTIEGNFVQGPLGTIVIELGGAIAGTDYDLLRVTGAATLDGALRVQTIAGAPIAEGSAYDFFTYASRTGDFAVFNMPAASTFVTTPGPTGYRVTARSAVPDVSSNTFAQVTETAQRDAVIGTERILITTNQISDQAERRKADEDGECR